MSVTKNNHYIPCLWSAYWNANYFNTGGILLRARDQVIFSLNIPSKKILQHKVENIFFEKRMGLADLNKQEVIEYLKRNRIEYDETELKDDLTWDFENFFTMMDTSSEKILKKLFQQGKSRRWKRKLNWAGLFILFNLETITHLIRHLIPSTCLVDLNLKCF